jgi:hypothetical protein
VFTGTLVGTAAIRADDGSFTDDTGTITVAAGAPNNLVLTPASTSIAAGGSAAFTAEAFDLAGNSLGDVTGPAVFTITPDGSCTGATCTATVAGAHVVTGTWSAVQGTANVTVTPGAATTLVVTASSPQAASTPFDITVTARDAFGNTATGYTGTVAITSTAPTFLPPSDHTFTGPDLGVATISVTIADTGTFDITATDTGTGTITGTRAGLVVN